MKKYLVPAIFTILIVAVLFFAIRALVSSGNDASSDTASPTPTSLTDKQKEGLKEGQKTGNPDAAIVLTTFGDLQCPACKAFEPTLLELRSKYSDKLLVIWKNFPLYPQPHKNARVAAYAAEAAANQGKFWQMHDKLYEVQDDWAELSDPKDKFKGYAKDLGLDVDKFSKDIDNQVGKDTIDRDLALAKELKLGGTPSFFLNGEAVEPANVKTKVEALINSPKQ